WLYNQVNGLNKYMIKTDGAGTVARLSDKKYGKWYEPNEISPKEGDIVMFRWGGSYTDKYHSDHVGYVYKVDNKYIYVIEGNTGSANADTSTVMYKKYSKNNSCINGYYRPNYETIESEGNVMNFKKGNKGDGVLAYKSLLIQAEQLGLIETKVAEDNIFGNGTHKATLEVQKMYKLEQDGIAGVKTITALRNAVNNKIKVAMQSHNNIIDDLSKKLLDMKV
ncbi:MAG: CHAP domain-containing protein, partial [Acutalibacteraceae bacterium]|nr:CHAP domain-containing protein [Acutalibacteraceae bacterium]